MSNEAEAARRLILAREAAGYKTCAQAAKAVGVSYPTYAGHENGSRRFGRAAFDYAKAFGVSVGWLLAGEEEAAPRPVAPAPDEPKDQRVPIMMTASEVAAIEDWMFANRIRSRAEAIRELCKRGLAASR